MLKHFCALIFLTVLHCGLAPALADSPFDVTPTHYPVLPSLIEINEPAVCAAFLSAVTGAYRGPDFDIKTVGHRLPEVDARWLLSAEDMFEGSDDQHPIHNVVELKQTLYSWDYMTSVEVDFAKGGGKNVLAVFGSEDNALRRGYVVALFDRKAELDAALAAANSVDAILKDAAATWRLDRPSILEIDGAFYAVPNPQSFDNKDVREELWRLTVGGAQLACSVQLAPAPDSRSPKAHLAGTAIGDLDRSLSAIAGYEPRCTGSLHFMDQAVIDAAEVLQRIESRPWTLGEVEPYNGAAEIDAGLHRWSRRGLWNHRKLRELHSLTGPAHDFLKRYYRHGFGLSQAVADRLADASFDLIMRSRFRFPSQPLPIDMDDPTFKLHGALLAHGAGEWVEELLNSGAMISNSYIESEWRISTEPTLFYALESPELIELLLKRGANVNARGNFGKTALMYAVQFNLPDSARLMLERGADVNAATTAIGDCWTGINIANRTALMYAAENADLAMVELLLRHGADAKALDSRKRAADSYVDRNRTLDNDKGMELYRRLRDAKGLP